jgi:hypothetical protein
MFQCLVIGFAQNFTELAHNYSGFSSLIQIYLL